MLTLFEAGDLHPRIAYVLYGEPAYASPEASACAGQFRKSPLMGWSGRAPAPPAS
jgi:hypothetical protein